MLYASGPTSARMSGERSSSAGFVSYAANVLLIYTYESTSLSVSIAGMSAAGGDQYDVRFQIAARPAAFAAVASATG